jgi:hypothetical protein
MPTISTPMIAQRTWETPSPADFIEVVVPAM